MPAPTSTTSSKPAPPHLATSFPGAFPSSSPEYDITSPDSASSPLTLTSSIPLSASSEPDESLAREIEELQDLATSLRENLKLRPLRSPSPALPLPTPSPRKASDFGRPANRDVDRGGGAEAEGRRLLRPLELAPPAPPVAYSYASPSPASSSSTSSSTSLYATPPQSAFPRSSTSISSRSKLPFAPSFDQVRTSPESISVPALALRDRTMPHSAAPTTTTFHPPPKPALPPAPPKPQRLAQPTADITGPRSMSLPNGPTPLHPPRPLPTPLSPSSLLSSLSTTPRPLLLDTRPLPAYLTSHLPPALNLAIPSLILKRCAKPGGSSSFPSLSSLRGYITTDSGRELWDELLGNGDGAGDKWNGDVVVFDEEMDERGRTAKQLSTAWTLTAVLPPLVPGDVAYLRGGLSALRSDPSFSSLLISGSSPPSQLQSHAQPSSHSPNFGAGGQELTVPTSYIPSLNGSNTPHSSTSNGTPSTSRPTGSAGLFSLRTDMAGFNNKRAVTLEVDIEPPSNDSLPPPPSLLHDASPSPPPSAAHFPRSPGKRLAPSLSAEHLGPGAPPKLQLRTTPLRSATLPVPPSPGLLRIIPPSPSHLRISSSPLHSPLPSPIPSPLPSPRAGPTSLPPPSPTAPLPPPSPHTARPPLSTDTPSSAPPPFTISTILPSFLYLGPEPSTDDEVDSLLSLGIKRILNMAEECDDDRGLALRRKFEMYERVPMRDTVEEANIGRGVRAACLFLDDARLHSSPTYVHCKAGKSRSVAVVMGYLIHANHWPLARAYSFVLERRRGISPNIGFVGELMKFEEQTLGTKSAGVHAAHNNGHGLASAHPRERVRESLPPLWHTGSGSMDGLMGGLGGGPGGGAGVPSPGIGDPNLGDHATETEVKDSSGRYVHMRRVPVDGHTLQPQRRVSKAGLESGW